MASEIKLNCTFRESDFLEVAESQGKVYFQLEGLDEQLQLGTITSVYSTPEDAIKFAERVIRMAREIKGGRKT